MLEEHWTRFQVTTTLPELLNQRIERIDVFLKEVNLMNQSGQLVARGSAARQICFRVGGAEISGPNNRLRRVCDQFQFSVRLGDALPEIKPSLHTELRPEYYTFQPGNANWEGALLEQGFILSMSETLPADPPRERFDTFLIDRVVTQGDRSAQLTPELALPAGAVPKEFSGTIKMNPDRGADLKMRLTGTVIYHTPEGRLAEIELHQEFNVTDLQLGQAEQMPDRIWAQITNHHFWSDPKQKRWVLALQIDYHWVRLQREKMLCAITPSGGGPNLPALLAVPVADRQHRIAKIVIATLPDLTPTEVQCSISGHQERLTTTGLLSTVDLHIEIYGIDAQQCETYHTTSYHVEELLADIPAGYRSPELKFETSVELQTGDFTVTPGKLRLPVILNYHINWYREESFFLVTAATGLEWIIAKQLLGRQDFFWEDREFVRADHDGAVVKKVAAIFLNWRVRADRGWLSVTGEVEMMFSCLQQLHCWFQPMRFSVAKVFFWDGLPEGAEIDCQPFLEADAVQAAADSVFYHYSIKISCRAWLEKPVPVQVVPAQTPEPVGIPQNRAPFSPPSGEQTERPAGQVTIAETISLGRCIPVEFIANELTLSHFSDYHLGSRLFIAGILEWRTQFWNQNGFFENEIWRIPFWRYLEDAQFTTENHLEPRIRQFSVEPLSGGRHGVESPVPVRPRFHPFWRRGKKSLVRMVVFLQLISGERF